MEGDKGEMVVFQFVDVTEMHLVLILYTECFSRIRGGEVVVCLAVCSRLQNLLLHQGFCMLV